MRVAIKTASQNHMHRQHDRLLLLEAYEQAKAHVMRMKEPGSADDDGIGGDTGIEVLADVSERRADDKPRKKLFGEVPRIEGEHIVLERIVESDADALQELADNEAVYRFEPTFLFERQQKSAQETIRLLYGELFTNKESLILGIRLKDATELVGLAEFYGLRDDLHKTSLGYRLLERYWGRGIATETVGLMIDYLYNKTDIEIITASTMVENLASARVLQKNDFIRTARAVEEDWGHPTPTIVDKWFC